MNPNIPNVINQKNLRIWKMSSRVNISNLSIKKNNKKKTLNSPWDQHRQVYRDCLVSLANPVRKQGFFNQMVR